MKYLILGHTGFVGKNLKQFLIDRGHQVFGISRKECDLRDYEGLCKILEEIGQVDAIFNCAANVGSVHYVTEKAAEVITDNTLMAVNLYKAVLKYYPDATVVNPLSNCCYADGNTIQEEQNWLKGEVHHSVFSFGNFKRVLYYVSRCYNMQYGVKSINLMFPGIYGPGDSTDPNKVHALNGMIIRMLDTIKNGDPEFEIWGTGRPIREWIYIDDVCAIMLNALKLKESVIEPVNIAQGKGFSIAETAGCIAKSVGYDGDLVFNTKYQDGAAIKILGNRRFVQVFEGYRFYDHEEGVKQTVDYYKEML